MPRVIVSPVAHSDMGEVLSYIAKDNPGAADNPGIGVNREGLQVGLRSFAFGNYVIFYRHLSETVEIVRVLHAARDIASLLG